VFVGFKNQCDYLDEGDSGSICDGNALLYSLDKLDNTSLIKT